MAFLKNAWYAAGWSGDIGQDLLARTILGEPVLLFRRQDGTAAALADRCPHRFVPLHFGKLKGDVVECGYHGLCFNDRGDCTLNPHGTGLVPQAAKVRSYPLCERQGIAWIWMGLPEDANTELICDFEPLGNESDYATVRGHLHVDANYQLITDNLLDLTHGQYIHPLFTNDAGPSTMIDSPREADAVWARFVREGQYPNKFFQMLGFPADQLGNHRNFMRWQPPGNLFLDVGMASLDSQETISLAIPTTHLLTPETETTTHYFWAMSRNFQKDDADLSEKLLRVGLSVFNNEDKPVIEAQQRFMRDETDIFKLDPVLLSTDTSAVRARRIMKERIEEEHGRAAAK